MALARTKSNVVKALRSLSAVALVAVLWLLVEGLSSLESEAGRLAYKIVVMALILGIAYIDALNERATRICAQAAPWVLRHDVAWWVARAIVYLFAPLDWLIAVLLKTLRALRRAASAAWAFLKATPVYRFLDRHRRAVMIVLVAAISLRAFAALSLLESSADITLWHWAVFGTTYLAFGITAPFVAAILLWRRGEWVMVVAAIWLLLGIVGVVFAGMFSLFVAAYFAAGPQALLLHPLFPEPLGAGRWAALLFAELLVQVVALHFLGGRTADYYQDRQRTAC